MPLSRMMRYASVGALAAVSLSALGYFWLWLVGLGSGGKPYRATIEFVNAGGMQPGTAVAYRGVRVGKVVAVTPNPTGVDVEVEIDAGTLLIPSNSSIEANQSGLIGETAIDIKPLDPDLSLESAAPPLDSACDPAIVICDGSRLSGESQLNVNALIRSVQRISNILSSPEFTANLNAVSRNASVTLSDIAKLSDELETFVTDESLQEPLGAITEATVSIDGFLDELERPLVTSLESLDKATQQIGTVIDVEGNTVRATLTNIAAISDELRGVADELAPVLARVNQSEIVANFDALSVDAVAAAKSLLDLSDEFGDPESIERLQQTLDSARGAFEALMKVTSDTDEVTGDPEFRDGIRDIVEALEELLSSTQQLERQLARARLERALATTATPDPQAQ